MRRTLALVALAIVVRHAVRGGWTRDGGQAGRVVF
jgi:hypothetical protein